MSHPPSAAMLFKAVRRGALTRSCISGTGSGSGWPLELLSALHKAGPTQGLLLSAAPVH